MRMRRASAERSKREVEAHRVARTVWKSTATLARDVAIGRAADLEGYLRRPVPGKQYMGVGIDEPGHHGSTARAPVGPSTAEPDLALAPGLRTDVDEPVAIDGDRGARDPPEFSHRRADPGNGPVASVTSSPMSVTTRSARVTVAEGAPRGSPVPRPSGRTGCALGRPAARRPCSERRSASGRGVPPPRRVPPQPPDERRNGPRCWPPLHGPPPSSLRG